MISDRLAKVESEGTTDEGGGRPTTDYDERHRPQSFHPTFLIADVVRLDARTMLSILSVRNSCLAEENGGQHD